MKQRLVIIDGKSIFYRGYYAMPGLTTSKGLASGGVYGFVVLALNVIKKLKPDYVCVAWDKSKTNIRRRRELYPEYKAQRRAAPASFYEQIPVLFELLEAFNWPLYELDDYEADDIMATLAKQAQAQGLETVLVSSDLDLLQAIDKNVHFFVLKQGLRHIVQFDEAEFKNKYELDVEQFRDLKALMGDSSDNVPGVAGVGLKKATELLKQYQTLEEVYEHLDEIPETVSKKLRADKDMAFLSQQLVTLMLDAPIKLDLPAMSLANLDYLKLQQNLRELEFYSLLRQLPREMQSEPAVDFVPQTKLSVAKPQLKEHDSLAAIADLNWKKPVFLHAYCRQRFGQKPLFILASDNVKTVHLFRVDRSARWPLKKAVFFGYDTKQLAQVLTSLGCTEVEVEHDVKVADFLFNPSRRLQSLSALAADYLNYVGELDELDEDDFFSKAAEITAIVFELKRLQLAQFKKAPSLKKLATDIEWPFIPVLARLEKQGIMLDQPALKKLKAKFQKKIADLEKGVYDLAGQEFNLASPAQLSEILYGKLEISTAGIRKNRRGYSTDAESLGKLKTRYPIVALILQWRELTKLQNTYVEGLLEHVDDDGRVYSEMRLTAVATGRLSSANPNLQNIPIKTEIGTLIRRTFIAPPKHKLISADYSQFELRLAAVLAGDQSLIDAFEKGLDIHLLTASTVFEVPLDKVSKQQRYLAKTINFGVLYGQGPHSLANLTGMSYAQAKDFIAKYFAARPLLKEYQEKIRKLAEKQGYVETLFGRRRWLPDINSPNFQLKAAAFRQAINMPIQGTEADLMKIAMIELDKKLNQKSRQVMQIHDSILVEAPAAQAEETADLMRRVMENVYPPLGITLKVETAIDASWPIT